MIYVSLVRIREIITAILYFQISDGSGMKTEATPDDLIKTVEELTRIH